MLQLKVKNATPNADFDHLSKQESFGFSFSSSRGRSDLKFDETRDSISPPALQCGSLRSWDSTSGLSPEILSHHPAGPASGCYHLTSGFPDRSDRLPSRFDQFHCHYRNPFFPPWYTTMDSPWYTSVAAWWQHGGSMVYPWWSQRFSMFFHLRLDAFDAIFVQPLLVQLRPWTSWTRPTCPVAVWISLVHSFCVLSSLSNVCVCVMRCVWARCQPPDSPSKCLSLQVQLVVPRYRRQAIQQGNHSGAQVLARLLL